MRVSALTVHLHFRTTADLPVIQAYAMDADKQTILWQSNAGQSTGGCIVTSRAGGRQLIGVASGMKSPMWPGGAQQSRILVSGFR